MPQIVGVQPILIAIRLPYFFYENYNPIIKIVA